MPLIDRQLREIWDALRAEGAQRRDSLRVTRIKHLRGIRDLRVPFPYPVCVLAGPNGCGKSTVLFACACAYQDPDRGPRDFAPSSLFPNFAHGRQGELSDTVEGTELEFDYVPGWRELRHGLEKGTFLQMGSQLPGPKRWKTTATGTIPSHSRESHQSVGGARPSATCSKAVSDGRTYA